MGKTEYKEMMKMRENAEGLIEQIFLDNGYTVQREVKIEKMIMDFLVEKNGKKYILEVKRGDFDIGKIRAIAERLNMVTKSTEYIPVLIIINRRSTALKEGLEKDYGINIIDISNLLYIVSKNQNMKEKLINILNFSTENIIEKSIDFNIDLKQYLEYDNNNYGYIQRLDSIIEGNNNADKYEKFCVDVLKYLFSDILSLWEEQKKSNDDLYRFDLICKIKNNTNSEFFNTIEKYFLSKYIVFEFKNYIDEITQREVYTTEKYLYKTALRMVAIILTRNGVDKNGMKAIKWTLRENGKLLIVLDDNDIKQMIYAKENGEDYNEILINKLDNLLMTLEK